MAFRYKRSYSSYAAKKAIYRDKKRRLNKRIKKVVKNEILEKKFQAFSNQSVTVSGSPTIYNINPATSSFWESIVQGQVVNNRIGNKIHVSSVHISYTLTPLATMVPAGCQVRVILFLDKKAANRIPNASEYINNAGAGAAVHNSQRNPVKMGNFSTLYDRIHPMVVTAVNGASVVAVAPKITESVWLKINKTIEYSANTASPVDICNYNLYLMIFADNSTSALFEFAATTFFTDA